MLSRIKPRLNRFGMPVVIAVLLYGLTLLWLPIPKPCAITPSATAVDYHSEDIARPGHAALRYVLGGVMTRSCFGAEKRTGNPGWSVVIAQALQQHSYTTFRGWIRIYAFFITAIAGVASIWLLLRKKS